MVGDAGILEAIEEHGPDLDSAARELITRANRGGGEDNITVVFFEIAEEGAAAPEETAVRPAAVEAEATQEPDEETLDELDRVPAVATQVFKVEELEAAVAAPPAKKRRSRMDRLAARVLATVVVLAVVAGIVLLVVWGLLD
jgi:serine/threonine protein phosphatase PrpC